jgi:hypothetical protein
VTLLFFCVSVLNALNILVSLPSKNYTTPPPVLRWHLGGKKGKVTMRGLKNHIPTTESAAVWMTEDEKTWLQRMTHYYRARGLDICQADILRFGLVETKRRVGNMGRKEFADRISQMKGGSPNSAKEAHFCTDDQMAV